MSAVPATVLALVYDCLSLGEVHERCQYVCRHWHSVPHPNPGRVIVLTNKFAGVWGRRGLCAREINARDNGVCPLTPLAMSAHALRWLAVELFEKENLETLFSLLPSLSKLETLDLKAKGRANELSVSPIQLPASLVRACLRAVPMERCSLRSHVNIRSLVLANCSAGVDTLSPNLREFEWRNGLSTKGDENVVRAAFALTLLDKLVIDLRGDLRRKKRSELPLLVSSPLRVLVLRAWVTTDVESLPPTLEKIALHIPTTVKQREVLPGVTDLDLCQALDDCLLLNCPNVHTLTLESTRVAAASLGRLQGFHCLKDLRIWRCGLSAADVVPLCALDLGSLCVIDKDQDSAGVPAKFLQAVQVLLQAWLQASPIPHKRLKIAGVDFATPDFPIQLKFST